MAETPYTAYSYPEGSFMAVIHAFTQDALDRAEPLTVAAAYAQCRAAALAESVIGAVGLEIESHLVDLDHVADPFPGNASRGSRAPAPGWPWLIAVSGWLSPGLIRRARPGGSTRGRVTAPWNSTSRPPAGPRPGGS